MSDVSKGTCSRLAEVADHVILLLNVFNRDAVSPFDVSMTGGFIRKGTLNFFRGPNWLYKLVELEQRLVFASVTSFARYDLHDDDEEDSFDNNEAIALSFLNNEIDVYDVDPNPTSSSGSSSTCCCSSGLFSLEPLRASKNAVNFV